MNGNKKKAKVELFNVSRSDNENIVKYFKQ